MSVIDGDKPDHDVTLILTMNHRSHHVVVDQHYRCEVILKQALAACFVFLIAYKIA